MIYLQVSQQLGFPLVKQSKYYNFLPLASLFHLDVYAMQGSMSFLCISAISAQVALQQGICVSCVSCALPQRKDTNLLLLFFSFLHFVNVHGLVGGVSPHPLKQSHPCRPSISKCMVLQSDFKARHGASMHHILNREIIHCGNKL